MTNKPASLDDITQYLDESGNLVDGRETWTDSEKLMHIKRELNLWISELNRHLIWVEEGLKESRQLSTFERSLSRFPDGYLQGRKEEIRAMHKYISVILYRFFRDNNNQKDE